MAEDEILIIHGGGTIRATATSLTLSAKFATGVAIRPPAIDLLSPDIEIFNPMKLGRLSDAYSVLSGQPAIIYRRGKLEIALTPIGLIRMVRKDLRPSEVKVLRDRSGVIDEMRRCLRSSFQGASKCQYLAGSGAYPRTSHVTVQSW